MKKEDKIRASICLKKVKKLAKKLGISVSVESTSGPDRMHIKLFNSDTGDRVFSSFGCPVGATSGALGWLRGELEMTMPLRSAHGC